MDWIGLLKFAVENKDLWGSLLMMIIFFFGAKPILKYLIDEKFNKIMDTLNKILNTNGKYITQSTEETIQIVDWAMQAATDDKISHIVLRLEKNNLQKRRDQISKQLLSKLGSISKETYLNHLNRYKIKGGILLGDYVKDTFNPEFFEELQDVFFSDASIKDKVNQIKGLMELYRQELLNDLNIYLTGK